MTTEISEAATQTEMVLFDEFKVKIHALLDDLKSKGYTKKPTRNQIEGILKIIAQVSRASKTYNILTNLFKGEELETFLEFSKAYGLTKHNFPELYASILIEKFNEQTETFKLTFLIMLNTSLGIDSKTTLGTLRTTLDKKSTLAADITKEIDVELRNAFAHYTYWYENGKVSYCKDTTLENPQELDIGMLMLKAKRQNILFQAFLQVFAEKVTSRFFA